jgi:hypothetical protein
MAAPVHVPSRALLGSAEAAGGIDHAKPPAAVYPVKLTSGSDVMTIGLRTINRWERARTSNKRET